MSQSIKTLKRIACVTTSLIAIGYASSVLAQTQVSQVYGYDEAGRLIWTNDGTTQITYTWDASSNMLSRTVPEPSNSVALSVGLLALAALGRSRQE